MIAVRLATLDDAEIIARQTSQHSEALADIFKPPSSDLFPPQKLAALLRDPNSIVAVAEINVLTSVAVARAKSIFCGEPGKRFIALADLDEMVTSPYAQAYPCDPRRAVWSHGLLEYLFVIERYWLGIGLLPALSGSYAISLREGSSLATARRGG